jgi:hypothetical protein
LNQVITSVGIPQQEIEKLLQLPIKQDRKNAVFIRPMAIKNVGFARGVLQTLKEEMKGDLRSPRKDGQKAIDKAFRLIICNLVACCFERRPLAIPGSNDAYNKGKPLQKMFLTKRGVDKVREALITHEFITFKKGNSIQETSNLYLPTEKLSLRLIPLIYEVYEEYSEATDLILFTEVKEPKKGNNKKYNNKINKIKDNNNEGKDIKSIKRRRSEPFSLLSDHPDLVALRRINEALSKCTYPLKGPIRRIFSDKDPMRGGRLYTRLQTLPDKRARIRINTLFNGEPVAEVDLSANHPRMLMALQGKELPAEFYDEVAAATKTTREQVKFLLMKAIGAADRRISLKLKFDEKDWFKTDFVLSKEQRSQIERYLEENYPDLFSSLYRELGIFLQGLEGSILLRAMLSLLDQGIPSLPIHDALYVQARNASQAKEALESAWMEEIGVEFRPVVKLDNSIRTVQFDV